METSVKIDETIALGNNLVALLRRKRDPDLLSEWMAQQVAECIGAASRAKGRVKVDAEDRCVATILQLWRHRASLPNDRRPFEKFEPILATLERLDPEHSRPFYFDRKPGWNPPTDCEGQPKPGSVEQYADLVVKLDQAARVMIEYLINEATGVADQRITRELLKSCVDDKEAAEVESVRRLLAAKDMGVAMHADTERRLNDRIDRLSRFISVATMVRREYEKRLCRIRVKKQSRKRPNLP